MIENLKQKLKHSIFVETLRGLKNAAKTRHELIYNPDDLTQEYYLAVQEIGDKELEHQIGRLINFKDIISEVKKNRVKGDVIEFGTWRGFSLLWLAYFLERSAILDKKIIGIDGFDGLPNTEGVFAKGAFSDTSESLCREGLQNSKHLYPATKKNIFIEKFFFAQKKELLSRVQQITLDKFCIIHIDCDISSSLLEIFKLFEDQSMIADECYILFDDYGWMDSYKNTVDSLIEKLKSDYIIQEHSQTKFTKNFHLKKKDIV